jgi:hypothetical protein
MIRTLYSDVHLRVTIDDDAGIVTYTRSREPYESIETIREIHQKVRDLLSIHHVGRVALLVDVREAPARNDDPFEAEITQALEAIRPRFTAHAILIKSAVGRLQAQRMAKSHGDDRYTAFTDEAAALAHLRKGKQTPA